MSHKETKLPGAFVPETAKNEVLRQASLRNQFRQGETVVAEAIRMERERITKEINKRIAEARNEVGWYARDYLAIVRDEIVNKP